MVVGLAAAVQVGEKDPVPEGAGRDQDWDWGQRTCSFIMIVQIGRQDQPR